MVTRFVGSPGRSIQSGSDDRTVGHSTQKISPTSNPSPTLVASSTCDHARPDLLTHTQLLRRTPASKSPRSDPHLANRLYEPFSVSPTQSSSSLPAPEQMEETTVNQTWEASAPVDDASQRSHSDNLADSDANHQLAAPTPTPTPPSSPSASSTPSTSTTDSAIHHLNSSVETMWEARRAREEAERLAEQKLIDAVCAASLLEYNEKNRALENYEAELAAKATERDQELARLAQRREQAERNKRDAMQKVIDAKTRAAQLSAKVKDAAKQYEDKAAERVEKEMEREAMESEREKERSMQAVEQRKLEAIKRREEAERKAQEALAKAEEMRRRAIQAASVVRQHSRLQIEHELSVEEQARQQNAQIKMSELEQDKRDARERKEAAARKAVEAQRRAEELRARAEQARLALRTKAATSA